MTARYYIGIVREGARYQTFTATATPTPDKYPQYLACIGPFRTRRGAEYMRQYGRGNPHCRCVAEAEKLAARHRI